MSGSITLRTPADFANEYLAAFLAQGFGSLSRRDAELLVFLLLERDGAVGRELSNYDVGRLLRLTPTRVKSLRRDAYARWRNIVGDDRKQQVMTLLATLLTEDRIRAGRDYASERTQKDGFLALRVEHADDREELEQLILDAGGIPVYERNRDVLVVRFDTLLAVGDKWGFASAEPKRIRAALKSIAPKSDAVKDLLKKNISDLRWEDVRRTFNQVGADALSGALDTKVTALLRIALPFLV